MRRPVYLDNHATTAVDPRVVEAMLPYFTERYGNAGSNLHAYGWEAEAAVNVAREQTAKLLGARPAEIVFTSGATESIHLALRGAFAAAPPGRDGVVTVATEHHAALAAAEALQSLGGRVTILPVRPDGRLDLERVVAALDDRTAIVSVMAANNEIGVLQPLAEIGALCRAHGALLHVDAAQALGKIPCAVETWQADLVSVTAHKLHGPKGVGALFVRQRPRPVALVAQATGGGQERGLRAGTLNTPGIVGFGKACELAGATLESEAARLAALRDRLLPGLRSVAPDLIVNGSLEHRLPNNLNVAVPGVDGATLLSEILKTVAVSAGAACSTGDPEPSHVLAALGLAPELISASIRFGLGRFTTDTDIDTAVAAFARAVGVARR